VSGKCSYFAPPAGVQGSHLGDIRVTQARVAMSIAARMPFRMPVGAILQPECSSATSNHIGRILPRGSKQQVGRVDTHTDIARMPNDLACRTSARCLLEGEAMDQDRVVVDLDSSVTVTTHMASPQPTGLRLLDAAPEACEQILPFSTLRCARADSRAVFAEDAGPASIRRLALETGRHA